MIILFCLHDTQVIYLKMTEAQVGFLYKIASSLPSTENNRTQTLLKSYYLMRCKQLTKGSALPERHFSTKVRCPHCCIEWNKETETTLKPIKLSKRQKKRIKSLKETKANKSNVKIRKDLLHSNQLEQICSLCKHIQITQIIKPGQQKIMKIPAKEDNKNIIKPNVQSNLQEKNKKDPQKDISKKMKLNLYSSAKDIFSLKNNNNTLATSVKMPQKVIKNNKRKKDKFAGLCQQAVLASARMKEKNKKQNKLNLFLRPST